MSDGARILRFHSRERVQDAERLRDALRSIARQFSKVTKYAEARSRADVAKESARLCAETMKLLQSVKS